MKMVEIHSACQNLRVQEYLKSIDVNGTMTFWSGLSYKMPQVESTKHLK